MKANVYRDFGSADRLRWEDVKAPAAGDGELLVEVRAASVNAMDWYLLRGRPGFIRLLARDRKAGFARAGHDYSGIVASVGRGVAGVAPGDAVFGIARGAFADFVVARPDKLAPKPEAFSFEDAAACPIAGVTALQGLRDFGRLRPGQRVLVNGAGGGVGTFAVQIARALGGEVDAVCGARNAEMVRGLGAGRIYRHEKEDFTHTAARYDLIFDLVSAHRFRTLRKLLTPNGLVVVAGFSGNDGRGFVRTMLRILATMLATRLRRQRMTLDRARLKPDDLATLAAMIASGAIRPAITARLPMTEAAEAVRRLGDGESCGKIVLING